MYIHTVDCEKSPPWGSPGPASGRKSGGTSVVAGALDGFRSRSDRHSGANRSSAARYGLNPQQVGQMIDVLALGADPVMDIGDVVLGSVIPKDRRGPDRWRLDRGHLPHPFLEPPLHHSRIAPGGGQGAVRQPYAVSLQRPSAYPRPPGDGVPLGVGTLAHRPQESRAAQELLGSALERHFRPPVAAKRVGGTLACCARPPTELGGGSESGSMAVLHVRLIALTRLQ